MRRAPVGAHTARPAAHSTHKIQLQSSTCACSRRKEAPEQHTQCLRNAAQRSAARTPAATARALSKTQETRREREKQTLHALITTTILYNLSQAKLEAASGERQGGRKTANILVALKPAAAAHHQPTTAPRTRTVTASFYLALPCASRNCVTTPLAVVGPTAGPSTLRRCLRYAFRFVLLLFVVCCVLGR